MLSFYQTQHIAIRDVCLSLIRTCSILWRVFCSHSMIMIIVIIISNITIVITIIVIITMIMIMIITIMIRLTCVATTTCAGRSCTAWSGIATMLSSTDTSPLVGLAWLFLIISGFTNTSSLVGLWSFLVHVFMFYIYKHIPTSWLVLLIVCFIL